MNRTITGNGTFGVNQAQTNCSYTYSSNGNMTARGAQTLTWDIDNRVTSVSISGGGTTSMEYDYSGMRVKKLAPAGTTLFPFQGYEIDSSGVITKFIKLGVESFAPRRGTAKLYYHNDHLGSVHTITSEAQAQVQLNEYDPWGGVSKSVGNIDPTHRFKGKELDPETGLYYYGGRYYDPEISRFVSPDPFVPSPGNPQSLNRYSYTLNNPQNYIDPSGFFFGGLFKAIGNFFKSIFKNPAVFLATLAVAVVTYGAAAWAAGAISSTLTATQVGAIAGAAAGASAGMVGAAMTGSSIWQGALLGGISGAVGGGVAGNLGARTTQGIIGGALAGGATSGALRTAFRGGNFLQNVIGGALQNGLLASIQAVAMKGWEYGRQFADRHQKASVEHGGSYEEVDGLVDSAGPLPCKPAPCQSLVTRAGITMANPGAGSGRWFSADSFIGKFIIQVSKVHDLMNGWTYDNGTYAGRGVTFDTAFDVLWNFPGMLPAAAYTGFALYGNPYSYSIQLRAKP